MCKLYKNKITSYQRSSQQATVAVENWAIDLCSEFEKNMYIVQKKPGQNEIIGEKHWRETKNFLISLPCLNYHYQSLHLVSDRELT